jgi:hypothetical protein
MNAASSAASGTTFSNKWRPNRNGERPTALPRCQSPALAKEDEAAASSGMRTGLTRATVREQCRFYGCGMKHPNSCYRYYVDALQHGAASPAETPSCQHFARSMR